jgi:hypothetical protein
MRNVYACVICGVHYLPPESMVYPETGITASPAHCAHPVCTEAAADGVGGVPLSVLEAMALRVAAEVEETTERTVTRGRSRRPGAAPGGGRSKLR